MLITQNSMVVVLTTAKEEKKRETKGKSVETIKEYINSLHEFNPMMGHRGCRQRRREREREKKRKNNEGINPMNPMWVYRF